MYTTIDEIEKDFNAKIAATEDATEKAELRAQKAEARAEFRITAMENKAREDAEAREAQVRERERSAWTREALVEYPLAAQFPELVRGNSEEEIKASAKATHERINRFAEETKTAALATASPPPPATTQNANEPVIRQAQQAYGAVTGAGGGQPPDNSPESEKILQNYVEKYNYGQRGKFFGERVDVSPSQTDEYVRLRGGPHLLEQLRRVAQIKYGPDSVMSAR